MLSISNVSAGQAGSYYDKDGYYARLDDNDNQWRGQLKNELGLPDQITREDFNRLVHKRDELAGFDLCFSAPKSVSLALCLNPDTRQDMIRAHEAAVTATLAKIEQREIGARVTLAKRQKQQHVKTGNMLAGCFNHYVSRNSDPQLHTHCVILNQTSFNGKIYAVHNTDLYDNKMLYGQLYRNELATELLQRGYDVTVTDSKKGFFELSGIKQDTIDHFSSRRQEIVEKLQEWGTSSPEAAERAALATRAAKVQRDLGGLVESWQETIQEIGGVKIEKAPGPIIRTDEHKLCAFVEGVDTQTHTKFAVSEKELRKAVLAAGVGSGMSEGDYDKLLQAHREVVSLGPRKDKPNGPQYYTTRTNLATEHAIFAEVATTKGSMRPIDPAKAAETLKANEIPDKPLTDQQRQAVLGIASTQDQYFAVQGLAGTGKTFMLNAARQVLESEGYEVKGACFTGKAAAGLQEDARIPSVTIHSFLNKLEKEAGHVDQSGDLQTKNEWNLQGLRRGSAREAWIVDEASMVDNSTLKQLMVAAKAKGAKVVFVGDDRQLLPVGIGNAYGSMVQRGQIGVVTLDEIQRQKSNQKLLQSVREAVGGDVAKSFVTQNVTEISKPNKRIQAIVDDYTRLTPEQQQGTVILTADNKARRQINAQIRETLKEQHKLPTGREYTLNDTTGRTIKREFSEGDKVIFLQNDNRLGVRNGQTGVVERTGPNTLTVKSGNKSIDVDLRQYKKIDHGYAMTTHKAQGITVDRVIVNMDSKQAQLNSRNAYYVDISRARHDVKIYVDDKAKIQEQVKNFAQKLTSQDFAKTPPAQEPAAPEARTMNGDELHRYCRDQAAQLDTQAAGLQTKIDTQRKRDRDQVYREFAAAGPQRQKERLAAIVREQKKWEDAHKAHKTSKPHFWQGSSAKEKWRQDGDRLERRRTHINDLITQYKDFDRDPEKEIKYASQPPAGYVGDKITMAARERTAARPEIKEMERQRQAIKDQAAQIRSVGRRFELAKEQQFKVERGQDIGQVAKQINKLNDRSKSMGITR